MKRTISIFLAMFVVGALATPSLAGKDDGAQRSWVDLAIAMTDAPDSAMDGRDYITYSITVTNVGRSDASEVTVEDPLAGRTHVWSAEASQGTCNLDVSCAVGPLPAGARAAVTIVALANAEAPDNTAFVSAAERDKNPEDNSASVTTTITPYRSPGDVEVDVTDDPDPYLLSEDLADGDEDGITYTITLTNVGEQVAPNDFSQGHESVGLEIRWSGLLLRKMTPTAGTCEGGSRRASLFFPGYPYFIDSGFIWCSLGTIEGGDSVQIELEMASCAVGWPEDLVVRSLGIEVFDGRNDLSDNDHASQFTLASGGTEICVET